MTVYTKKRVLIILTGGTIAGNVAENKAAEHIKSEPDSFSSILEGSIAILKRNWSIEVEPEIFELFDIDSSDMLPKHWTAIAGKIEESYDDFDAFIILHGTNTMGYTGAALSFALENINKPVILTGAQVPLGYLGSDATTNLVNSLRLAVWGYYAVKGVLCVFGSKVIMGTRIKKGTDFDYDPFKSFIRGNLGEIGRFIKLNKAEMDKFIAYLSKSKPLAIQSRMLSVKKEFDADGIASLTEFPGMSIDTFKTLVGKGNVRAFILRAYGAGDINTGLLDAFEYLKEREIPIVVTTQAPNGTANFQVNESGRTLKDRDLAIPAYDMSMEAMTTKLSWLLAQKLGYDQVKRSMLDNLHGEINIESESV